MNELRIGRLTANVADWPEPAQVPDMLRHLAGDRLPRALREQPMPDGEWCLRRLDIDVAFDPDRPLSALETDWADRIVTALRQSLRDGSRDVVRYLRPEQAVDDLLAGLALGRLEHDWAWRQVGLLQAGDPEPEADPRGLILLVLGRLPQGPVGALVRLVRRVGLAPAHRLLGRGGWARAAGLAAGGGGAAWLVDGPPDGSDGPGDPDVAATDREFAELAGAIAATGTLARAFRDSGLRPDEPTLRAWAVLAMAEADPSLLRNPDFRARTRAVAARVRPHPGHALGARSMAGSAGLPRSAAVADAAPPSPAGPDGGALESSSLDRQPSAAPDPGTSGLAGPPVTAPRASSPRPPLPDGISDATPEEPAEERTDWGGLLFLLNTAGDAGLPDVLDRPPFLACPSSWALHRIGLRLVPIEPDDPALLALAGLDAVPPPSATGEAEQPAVQACSERWLAATAGRLRGDPENADATDAELVRRMAHRQATIQREPGWVEVCLRLPDVALDVRRAGLDIDPGWVWWLGRVVRFRYE